MNKIPKALAHLKKVIAQAETAIREVNYWQTHNPDSYRDLIKTARTIFDTASPELVENITSLRRAMRPLIWISSDETKFRAMLHSFGLMDKALEDLAALTAEDYPAHMPNPNALLEREGNETEITAQTKSLETLEARLEALEKAAENGTPIEKRIVKHYSVQVRNKITVSMFNISIGQIIDLEALEHMLKSIMRLTASFGETVLSFASKASEFTKKQTGRVSQGVRNVSASFKALWERRIKPPDEATRKVWEQEAAVQILMGEAVPARRVPFIQALSLSGWDGDLHDRLKAAGADLAEVYDDPNKPFRKVKFSDTQVLARFTALTTLDLRNTQVADIAPLEKLTALTTLHLTGTHVADIAPLEKLTALTRLYLRNTRVADIVPLEKLTALTTLYLSNTQVADIAPLEKLTALTTLNLDGTRVADIAPLEKLTALTRLYLRNTRVADIAPLEKLTALTTLYLGGTQVADIAPLEKLTALTQLDLDSTRVADIAPLEKLTALTQLNLDGTQVADIAPLEKLTALKTLDLSNTQVADIAPLEKLTALTTLYLSNTQVADIAPLEKLTALTTLNLGDTRVADIAPLEKLTALTTLYLGGTQVKEDDYKYVRHVKQVFGKDPARNQDG